MADPPQGGGGAQPAPPAPAIGPAAAPPGEQQPTVATIPSPPEAATRLFGDVRKGLDKSATGEFVFCSLQLLVCLCFCSWSVCLFALGTGCIGYLGACVYAQRRKERFVLVGGVPRERLDTGCHAMPRSRVRGAERSAFSTALLRMRSDGHRRISPPQRTLFGWPAGLALWDFVSVICG